MFRERNGLPPPNSKCIRSQVEYVELLALYTSWELRQACIWKAFVVLLNTFAVFFLLKDARRSWLRTYNRAPLHRAARTSDIAPAIFGYSMKQLQTFPHSPEKWWKHIFAHYALRKAIKHLTYLLSKADLDSVMILLHERKVSTASNRSNSKLIYQVPQCRLNGTVFPSIQFE